MSITIIVTARCDGTYETFAKKLMPRSLCFLIMRYSTFQILYVLSARLFGAQSYQINGKPLGILSKTTN